jgi:flagellar motor switch/type III secretory pathway protein FliN
VIEEDVTSSVQMLPSESAEKRAGTIGLKEHDKLDSMPWLPCMLTLELPVVNFTIADLMKLAPGAIVETACHHTSDVPLRVNQLLIGWTEFDVIDDHLAVRITDQA